MRRFLRGGMLCTFALSLGLQDAFGQVAAVPAADTPTPVFEPIPPYNPPVPVVELNSPATETRPYLTADLLEIFFVSDRGGNLDIWSATRDSADGRWNSPYPVSVLNSSDSEWSPVVSADGLEIFFGTHRGLLPANNWNRVFRSTRSSRSSMWVPPVEAPDLNPIQAQDNFCSPDHLSSDGLRIYTTRRSGGDFDLFVSERSSVGSLFSEPTFVPGLLTGYAEARLCLSLDETVAVFGRYIDIWQLCWGRRDTPDEAFIVPGQVTALNHPACGTEAGYVSGNLSWIWFSSNRNGCPGPHDIYTSDNFTPTPTATHTPTPTSTHTASATPSPTVTHTPTWSSGVAARIWR